MRAERKALWAALGAGACWGGSFLAPRALPGTSPTTIALFRFLFFGLFSVGTLLFRRDRRPRLDRRTVSLAFIYASAGYSLYYSLLALGIQGIGVPFATAIIALLPLTILLASTPLRDWSQLRAPIVLILIGGVVVPLELFGESYSALVARPFLSKVVGLFGALAALGLWTWFAVRNARFMKRHPQWPPLQWAAVLGVAAAMSALLFFFLIERENSVSVLLVSFGNPSLLLWTGFMGIAGSWIASALWNYASRVLPGGALGMLLVFEAVFGLAFGFLYERRGPTISETVAIFGLVGGALLGIHRLSEIKRNGRSNSASNVSVE